MNNGNKKEQKEYYNPINEFEERKKKAYYNNEDNFFESKANNNGIKVNLNYSYQSIDNEQNELI